MDCKWCQALFSVVLNRLPRPLKLSQSEVTDANILSTPFRNTIMGPLQPVVGIGVKGLCNWSNDEFRQ